MKVVKKLDLGKDFDKELYEKLNNLRLAASGVSELTHSEVGQQMVTEVRRIAHQAYKLGQENPNV